MGASETVALKKAGSNGLTAKVTGREKMKTKTAVFALEREYAGLFDDVIPLNEVVRLFQAENKLETTMMMEIVKDVPLAK
jgi:hypothetical protein